MYIFPNVFQFLFSNDIVWKILKKIYTSFKIFLFLKMLQYQYLECFEGINFYIIIVLLQMKLEIPSKCQLSLLLYKNENKFIQRRLRLYISVKNMIIFRTVILVFFVHKLKNTRRFLLYWNILCISANCSDFLRMRNSWFTP